MKAKLALYSMSKRLGLFALAARLNQGKLPILCYHGFALNDENAFWPKLFMDSASFIRRMDYLQRCGYRVLTLDEGIRKLREKSLPKRALIITIDDGFYGVHKHAMPILKKHGFPATLYVTSYYVEKEAPVFRLAIQYIFWRTSAPSLDLSGLVPGDSTTLDLTEDRGQKTALAMLVEYGETRCDESQRQALIQLLGERLNVDCADLFSSRALSLMTRSELRELSESGIDLQLHTHRHRFPEDKQLALQELADNQRFLRHVSQRPLRHFCYPSGIWSKKQWQWLSEFGIVTAMTCDSGLNTPDTPALALRRFLDGANVSQIEFEAELCGFAEFVRKISAPFREGEQIQGKN